MQNFEQVFQDISDIEDSGKKLLFIRDFHKNLDQLSEAERQKIYAQMRNKAQKLIQEVDDTLQTVRV